MASWTLFRIAEHLGVGRNGRTAGSRPAWRARPGRSRTSRLEVLEQRALLSVGGAAGDDDWSGAMVGPSEGASPAAEVDEPTEGTWLVDLDSYVPMPLPSADASQPDSGPGLAISYDCLTGEETLHETTEGPWAESGAVLGDPGALGYWLSEATSNSLDPGVERGFSSLTRVYDQELSPWRVNCKIFMTFPNGSKYVGSGVLIDSMHVLTAGHCVHDNEDGGWATTITVVPAYEDGAQPYGEAHSVGLHSWEGWTDDESYNHDIGVIDLDRPIGALTGWYGYGYNDSMTFYLGNTFHNPGYPAESPYNGKYMYYWYGDFDYYLGNQIGITQDGYGGQSGSGAYHMEDGSRYVYAVLSNGTSGFENFVRLTEGKFDDIKDSFIANDTPSTFDLIPLEVSVSPSPINSGTALSSMSYVIHNYSSASWSGTVTADIYLSSNDNISTSDTLLATDTFTASFGAKGTTTRNVSSLPTIPVATASGSYYIGVIITTADYSSGNNDTDGQDAATLTVNHVNQAPTLSGLPNKTLNEDATLNNAIDLYSYAADLETADASLVFSITGNTDTGCGVTIDSNRYIDIAPTANWYGTSDVTIRVTDGGSLYAQDTFRITVTSVNDTPVLSGLPDLSLAEDGTLNNAIDLWAMASDVETADGSLAFSIVGNTSADCGVTIDSGRYVDVHPTANWNGTSDVTIRVTDGGSLTAQDTFRITVTSVNDAPLISLLPDLALAEDATLNNAIDLWAMASDIETADGSLVFSIVGNTSTACGVTIDSGRYIDVAPTANWNGTSDVTIRVTDGGSLTAQDTFRITVNPVNDAPIALGETFGCDEDATLIRYTYEGVLINDSDPDGAVALQAVLQSGPAHGAFTLNSAGWFSYSPSLDYHGTDSFTYKAFDGMAYSATATVTLVVASVNDAPVGVPDAFSCIQGDTLIRYSHEGVLLNDRDPDNEDSDPDNNVPLKAVSLSGPSHGTLTLYDSGAFSYTPHTGYHGTDSFTYRATDNQLQSAATTVTITVLERIPGDANNDGVVNNADAAAMAAHWGTMAGMGWSDGDFNGDGKVTAADAAILAANWGATREAANPATAVAPEPAILVGPVQADRTRSSAAERQSLRPLVAEAAGAGDSLSGQTVSDAEDEASRDVGDSMSGAADALVGVSPTYDYAASHDAALAAEYGPQIESADLGRSTLGRLARSQTLARRQGRAHDGTSQVVDLLLSAR